MAERSSAARGTRRRADGSRASSWGVSISSLQWIVITLGVCSMLYMIKVTPIDVSRLVNGETTIASSRDPEEVLHVSESVPLMCEGSLPEVDLSYWKDIPRDKTYESPWGKRASGSSANGYIQYVTFEPDLGGFNNIRMHMETVLVFAKATGRTLVMPPPQKVNLLDKPSTGFAEMFPVEAFSEYMDVLTIEEFLEKEGVTGRLGKLPPRNTSSGHSKREVQGYLREVADYVPRWEDDKQAVVFLQSPENPYLDDESTEEWLRDFLTTRRPQKPRTEIFYTNEMQQARIIHFRTSGISKCKPNCEMYRLLTHFYTFIGFSDPVAARHYRRVVRDAVHFRESLFCVASRIVHRLREIGHGDPGSWSGWQGEGGGIRGGEGWTPEMVTESGHEFVRKAGFSTFHVRRGDFHVAQVKPEAAVILEATKDIRLPGEVLYIATDERNASFFQPFEDEHLFSDYDLKQCEPEGYCTFAALASVLFLGDFDDLLEGVDPTHYGMIDTIVASQGRTFVGTYYSTFTGYITRLRGYYDYPTEFSWYFWNHQTSEHQLRSLAEDTLPRPPFWQQEWPTAWEHIDETPAI